MEQTDDELIQAYRDGETNALTILIERYLDPIYGFARRMTGKPDEAEDIAQETFVKVWKTLPRYKMTGTFKAWIFAIARNTAIDRLRKKKVAVFSDFEDSSGKNMLVETLADDPALMPTQLLEKAEEKGLLDKALLELAPLDREILLLHYGEDMTFEAVGKILNKPLNTVKSRHRRAVTRLREFFEQWQK